MTWTFSSFGHVLQTLCSFVLCDIPTQITAQLFYENTWKIYCAFVCIIILNPTIAALVVCVLLEGEPLTKAQALFQFQIPSALTRFPVSLIADHSRANVKGDVQYEQPEFYFGLIWQEHHLHVGRVCYMVYKQLQIGLPIPLFQQ